MVNFPFRSGSQPSTIAGASAIVPPATRRQHRFPRLRFVLHAAGVVLVLAALPVAAAQVSIPGPAGSASFGAAVAVLPNGNIVVTEPNAGGAAGAV